MDILQTASIFTKEDKKFNREMIQRTKHDMNKDSSANSIREKLSADRYFGCVNDILSNYRKRWGIV